MNLAEVIRLVASIGFVGNRTAHWLVLGWPTRHVLRRGCGYDATPMANATGAAGTGPATTMSSRLVYNLRLPAMTPSMVRRICHLERQVSRW